MNEDGQQEMLIQNVDSVVLHQLIEYCYSGEIAINCGNVLEMTKAADLLQFNEVKENCAEFFISILSVSNCLVIRDIANVYHVAQVKQPAQDFILHNFLEVSKSDKFPLLNIDAVTAFLADDELNVPGEENVFFALMGWVKHDLAGRKQFLGKLLERVRFTHIDDSVSKSQFSNVIHQHSLEIDCPELVSMIATRKSSEDPAKSARSTKFKFHLVHKRFEEKIVKIDTYWPHQDLWRKVKDVDLYIESFALVYREGKLIIVGGDDEEQQVVNTVHSG